MTDQPRRRASGSAAAAAFGRAFASRDTTTVSPADLEDAGTPSSSSTSRKPAAGTEDKPSKFTVLLDGQAAADFDQLALNARRQLGRRVEKSELVRVLLALAADDPTLLGQVVDELRRRAG